MPLRSSTCSDIRASMAKTSKKCLIRSPGKSTIRSSDRSVTKVKLPRPLRSKETSASASSIGTEAQPIRRMPFLSPNAARKACPSTMPMSSIVWWNPVSVSPTVDRSIEKDPCFANCDKKWSKTLLVLEPLKSPLPFRYTVVLMSVSPVFLSTLPKYSLAIVLYYYFS